MSDLYIPKKIRVGFQKREDTFTGKLAYVVYYDDKGKLRKETSWENWRDKEIADIEFENTPQAGFILNKGVQRSGYHWGGGRSSIRVYDARDFEFEINVDNLMGVLMHSDVSKRDIVESCVFAWDGTELVLLPTNSDQYQKSIEYTKKQGEKLSAKELVLGYTYNQKKSEEPLVYVGYFEWFSSDSYVGHVSKGKKHVFFNEKNKEFLAPLVSSLSSVNAELVHSDYASIVQGFQKSKYSQGIKELKIIPGYIQPKENVWSYNSYLEMDGSIYKFSHYHSCRRENTVDLNHLPFNKFGLVLKGIELKQEVDEDSGYFSRRQSPVAKKLFELAKKSGLNTNKMSQEDFQNLMNQAGFGKLSVVLENGDEIDMDKFSGY